MFRKQNIFRVTILTSVFLILSVVSVAAAPLCHLTFATQVSTATVPKNQAVYDNVLLTTSDYYARLVGTFKFWVCGPTATIQDCSSGGTYVGEVYKDTYLGPNTTYTYPSSNFTPTQVGVYCFRVRWTDATTNEWSFSGDNPHIGGPSHPEECVTVVGPLTFSTSLGLDRGTDPFTGTPPFPVAAGTSVKDFFLIKPKVTGTINGTLKSFVCESATAQPCASGGTELPAITIPSQTLTANTVYTFTSQVFTPVSEGTYCFRTEFVAGPNSLFMDAIHIGGTADTLSECVKVSGATAVTLSSFGASDSAAWSSLYLGFAIAAALSIISVGLYLARNKAPAS